MERQGGASDPQVSIAVRTADAWERGRSITRTRRSSGGLRLARRGGRPRAVLRPTPTRPARSARPGGRGASAGTVVAKATGTRNASPNRSYASFPLDSPMFFEADLTLCPNPSAGSIHIALNAFGLEDGAFWMSACGPEHRSSRTWGGCGDFLWPQGQQDRFSSLEIPFDPGAWHRMRIEIDPSTIATVFTVKRSLVDWSAATWCSSASSRSGW